MKTRGRPIFIIGLLLGSSILLSLIMMSNALEDSERFGNLFILLLVINAIGLLVLVILIVLNFKRLRRELKNKVAGSVMTLRMVIMFSALSITPVLIVYYFSLDFLLRGIDNWFDLRVEQALDDSLELSRISLDSRTQELLKQTQQVAEELSEISDAATPFEIDELRARIGAEELTILTRQGGIIASSSGDSLNLVPDSPDDSVLLQLQQGKSFAGLDPADESGLLIRIAVNVPDFNVGTVPRIVQTLFPVTERMNTLANSVQTAFVDYKELSYLREQLKLSFVMILTLALLFSIFSVLWAAFYSAKKLAQPVSDLAKGTRAVAEGNYDMQLPVTSRDELGFLVASFNDMTNQIAKARNQADLSQQEAEAQRSRLATILQKLTSGVLVFDNELKLIAANNSTRQVLGVDLPALLGSTVTELAAKHPFLEQLFGIISEHCTKQDTDWREQIQLLGANGRQDLICSGTVLPAIPTVTSGHVVVFDDITALIQGQRDAAWSEMARRLAHEIKNPLTPIQLAAERLKHKYMDTMSEADSESLERLTNTIVQQVDTMKSMVNSFSEYARTPAIELLPCNLNQLIQEVVTLYRNNEKNIQIELKLANDLPEIDVDSKRLRQVLNNLIKNALEASENNGRLDITTELVQENSISYIQVMVRDYGKGLAQNIHHEIFEPYITTKKKGTGLGLAIVKKIIEEHSGMVKIENNKDGVGVCVLFRLPLRNNPEMLSATNEIG